MSTSGKAEALLRSSKFREWTKLIAITGSAQVGVQAIGFVSGILVVRLLSVQEYAFYTIANTMLGTMTVLADGGVASGVMSEGGKVWQDKRKLGTVLATGFALRRKFAIGSLLFATPIMLFMLQKQQASWLVSVLLVVSLVPAFVSVLGGRIFEIAPKLNQDIAHLQTLNIGSNLIRLLLSVLLLFVFPYAAAAIVASGIAQIWWNRRLRLRCDRYADATSPVETEVNERILTIVKRVLPTSIYFSFSLQLGIWLLSIFGSTESIAQLGAMSRITIVVGVFTTVFSYLIAPRFARLPDVPPLIKRQFVKIQMLLFLVCGLGYVVAFTLAEPVLKILPPEYASLTYAFRLQLAIAAFGVIIGSLASLNSSRGYVLKPQVHIPLNLAIVAATAAIFQPSTLIGVLHLDLARAAITPLVQNVVFFTQARREVTLA